MQHRVNGRFAGLGQRRRFLYLAQLNFSHHSQHVVLALEIVEEGALADIRGFGDVFDGDIGEPALAKEPKRATKQPQTRFGGRMRRVLPF